MTKNTYHKTEAQFCRQFEATPVKDKARQYQDIDAEKTVWRKVGGVPQKFNVTYSIKYQSLANIYDCFSFENKLINSDTGEFMKGNFHNCKANYIVITDGDVWWTFDKDALKQWMDKHHQNYERKTLTYTARMNNRKQGRTYDDAENIIVPRKDLEHLVVCKHTHTKRFKKDYRFSNEEFLIKA